MEELNKWCFNILLRFDFFEFRLLIYFWINVVCKIFEVFGVLLVIFFFYKKKDNIFWMCKNVLIFLFMYCLFNIYLFSGNVSVIGKEIVKFEFDIIFCEYL